MSEQSEMRNIFEDHQRNNPPYWRSGQSEMRKIFQDHPLNIPVKLDQIT